MTRLTEESLDFAKAHIEGFYDSDFFPKLSEYEALWSQWSEVRTFLSATNVEKLSNNPPRSMAAPKARGGYRIVHQLEPLDAIVYTALAHLVADNVENARSPTSAKNVFSYRISLTKGGFFGKGNGYAEFVSQCQALAATYGAVLVADIADFYNRIYLHRLTNNVSLANPNLAGTARSIEQFLLRLNSNSSQGVPVGPAASIVMSEAVLSDVDEFLRTKGFPYCRYVDDLRVFGSDRRRLEVVHEELVVHLYESQRLQLNNSKTGVMDSSDFVVRYLESPDKHEQRELLGLVQPFLGYADSYTESDIDELRKYFLGSEPDTSDGQKPKAEWQYLDLFMDSRLTGYVQWELVGRVLRLALASDIPDLGLTRYALRQARRLKIVDLTPLVLSNFERLSSAIPEVFLFLAAIATEDWIRENVSSLRAIASSDLAYRSAFVRHWFYWFIAGNRACFEDRELNSQMWNVAPIEFRAKAAATLGNVAWLRGQKSALTNFGRWDRRAILAASRIMSRDERTAWLGSIQSADPMENWIIGWVKKLP